VAVIEAGPSNTREIDMITTPGRAFELRGSKYDWGFKATFVDRPDYTRVEKPHTRGKVLGGCSCLNYYTWVRGSHGTYDDWAEFGGKTWNWNGCEEYFDKVCSHSVVETSRD
jgi:choline dehydrogenase-like flavoprotein